MGTFYVCTYDGDGKKTFLCQKLLKASSNKTKIHLIMDLLASMNKGKDIRKKSNFVIASVVISHKGFLLIIPPHWLLHSS